MASTVFTDLFGTFLRAHVTAGLSETGLNPPAKPEGRLIGAHLDIALTDLLAAIAGSGGVGYATRAELYADLAHAAGKMGFALLDPTAAYNGVYLKSGISGAGAWTISTDFKLLSSMAADVAEVLSKLEGVDAAVAAVEADRAEVAADKAIVIADMATVAADKATVIADAATVAADKVIVAADKATVIAAKAATLLAEAGAEAARDEALAYAELTGPYEFYATKAAADAALAGLSEGQLVQVWADESQGGARTVYKKVTGAYAPQTTLDYITPSSTDTLSNKTFSGALDFFTNAGRIRITDSTASFGSAQAIVHIVNGAPASPDGSAGVALLVTSRWEGSAASPFTNNDNVLFTTYSNITDNSFNKCWALSANNAYHNIPVGVTDSGERIGVIGWATSVAVPGYQHAGTLDSQYGIQGAVGFQGDGSAATAVINGATAVRGIVYADAPGATIHFARAGVFVSDGVGLDGTPGTASTVEDNIAVYARAKNGISCNYSFYGELGKFYNIQQIAGGPGEYTQSSSSFVSRRAGNSFEFGFADATGYGSNLGATATLGYPFLGFCAEADSTGDTFTTRGEVGWVISHNLAGALIFARLPTASAAGQTPTETMRLNADGHMEIVDATWDGPHMVLGGQHIWVNTTAQARVKGSAPSSEGDGTALYVPHGTAFPGSPATGDQFFRTDRNIEYMHDGARWVSTQLHELSFQEMIATVSAGAHAAIPYLGSYSLWLVSWTPVVFRNAAGDWDVSLNWRSASGTVTAIDTRGGGADADSIWISETRAIGAVLDATAKVLRLAVAENSGTAQLQAAASVQYRLIG